MNIHRQELRLLLRTRDDYQSMRKQIDNRIGRKADGTDQKIDERGFTPTDLDYYKAMADSNRAWEDDIEKRILKLLKNFPIYTGFLSEVKGVGPIVAGWIVSEIDIEKATTVSKIWQYAGLNPGFVQGIKRKDTDGEVEFIRTETPVKGDRRTPGFVSPFNGRLRTVLCGILADGFIKANSPYRLLYYDPYKERLTHETRLINGEDMAWCDSKPARRHNAAKRYMIKMFLRDLYAVWRQLEGLPVRPPYSEEYLNKKHEEPALV